MWSDDVIEGLGLGLRTVFIEEVLQNSFIPKWFEVAPENWINKGGYLKLLFEQIRAKVPVVCHGLSLSIGSPDPIDFNFLKQVKNFLDYYEIPIYSEHLSFSSYKGKNTYDLLPLPLTKRYAEFIADKISKVQDFLKRQIAIENASVYIILEKQIEEVEFIQIIVEKSGAKLLLDINNVYVNSLNHKFNPKEYIRNINPKWIEYYHIAGHKKLENGLVIDTHGSNVPDEVLELMQYTLKTLGIRPILYERDNNIPPYNELLNEYIKISNIINEYERV